MSNYEAQKWSAGIAILLLVIFLPNLFIQNWSLLFLSFSAIFVMSSSLGFLTWLFVRSLHKVQRYTRLVLFAPFFQP